MLLSPNPLTDDTTNNETTPQQEYDEHIPKEPEIDYQDLIRQGNFTIMVNEVQMARFGLHNVVFAINMVIEVFTKHPVLGMFQLCVVVWITIANANGVNTSLHGAPIFAGIFGALILQAINFLATYVLLRRDLWHLKLPALVVLIAGIYGSTLCSYSSWLSWQNADKMHAQNLFETQTQHLLLTTDGFEKAIKDVTQNVNKLEEHAKTKAAQEDKHGGTCAPSTKGKGKYHAFRQLQKSSAEGFGASSLTIASELKKSTGYLKSLKKQNVDAPGFKIQPTQVRLNQEMKTILLLADQWKVAFKEVKPVLYHPTNVEVTVRGKKQIVAACPDPVMRSRSEAVQTSFNRLAMLTTALKKEKEVVLWDHKRSAALIGRAYTLTANLFSGKKDHSLTAAELVALIISPLMDLLALALSIVMALKAKGLGLYRLSARWNKKTVEGVHMLGPHPKGGILLRVKHGCDYDAFLMATGVQSGNPDHGFRRVSKSSRENDVLIKQYPIKTFDDDKLYPLESETQDFYHVHLEGRAVELLYDAYFAKPTDFDVFASVKSVFNKGGQQ